MALSDPGGILASPFSIIERQDEQQAIDAIIEIIGQQQVEQIIVGLPRSMGGTVGRQAEKVRDFAEELHSRAVVPLAFRDERLTTVAAQRLMKAAGAKKMKRKVRDDAVAAALILQGYLDEVH